MERIELATFKYFLEGYFNISTDFSDLQTLAKRFSLSENSYYLDCLKNDLDKIIQLNDWEIVHSFVLEYGMRNLSKEKLIQMVQIIQKEL